MSKPLPLRNERVHSRAIITAAAHHAVGAHEGEFGPLTPFGIATAAASCAYVLTNEDHPNHATTWERCVDKGWLSE